MIAIMAKDDCERLYVLGPCQIEAGRFALDDDAPVDRSRTEADPPAPGGPPEPRQKPPEAFQVQLGVCAHSRIHSHLGTRPTGGTKLRPFHRFIVA